MEHANQHAQHQDHNLHALQDKSPTIEKEMKFRWGKDKKLGTQRPAISGNIPVLTYNGIVEVLEKGKDSAEYKLLEEITTEAFRDAVSTYLNDNPSITTFDQIDLSKLTWTAIANQSKEDRRSNKISEEQWEAFSADYLEVMPGPTGKNAEQLGNSLTFFKAKLSPVKTRKDILAFLKDQLAIYITTSKNADNFEDIISLLDKKADTYLKSDDVETLIKGL